jgi:hypothetical protein
VGNSVIECFQFVICGFELFVEMVQFLLRPDELVILLYSGFVGAEEKVKDLAALSCYAVSLAGKKDFQPRLRPDAT